MSVRNVFGAAVAATLLSAFAASGVAQAETPRLNFVICKTDPTLNLEKPSFRKECRMIPGERDPDCNVCPAGFISVQGVAPGAIINHLGSST
jgi:hypothetical protein